MTLFSKQSKNDDAIKHANPFSFSALSSLCVCVNFYPHGSFLPLVSYIHVPPSLYSNVTLVDLNAGVGEIERRKGLLLILLSSWLLGERENQGVWDQKNSRRSMYVMIRKCSEVFFPFDK